MFKLSFILWAISSFTTPAAPIEVENTLLDFEEDKIFIEYHIIVTGGELLQGKYPDSHTQSITRTLAPIGFRCVSSITVGDKSADLRNALEFGGRKSSLVLVTGGLGPTSDDITRDVLSEFSGIPLQENRAVIAQLEKRFSVSPGELRENVRRQALTPINGTYLPNPHGTAVGLVFEKEDQLIVALPGPPRELRPMLTEELVPLLSQRFGTRPPGASVQMRFVGIGESSIDKAIHDHLILPEGLEISSLFEAGRVDLTFSLPGNSPEATAQLKALEKRLAKEIGQYMYSDTGSTLEECVIQMLEDQDITLGLAEVGSGGAISASLNALADSRQVLMGGLTAASDGQMSSMIRPRKSDPNREMELDRAMVNRLCNMLSSTWGLLVTGAKNAEDNSFLVKVVIGTSEDTLVEEQLSLRGSGEVERSWLVSSALDLLRKELKRNLNSGQ